MKISKNAIIVATALKMKGVGNKWVVENIKADSTESDIIERLAHKKQKSYKDAECEFDKCKRAVESEIESLENHADGIIAFCDEGFPTYKSAVKSIDKPALLTYKGDLKLLDEKLLKIAVIGLLNPCEKIKDLEEKITAKMLQKDAVIVSGLAKGCDQIAHEIALKHNGATIAILPSILRKILPSSNAELADEIVANGGLLISEYIDECANPRFGLSQRYIERDRLQALFSDAVCLVASYAHSDSKVNKSKDSGARHALGRAKEWDILRIAPKGKDNDERFNLNREILGDYKNPAIEINTQNIDSVIDKIIQSKQTTSNQVLFLDKITHLDSRKS